MLADLAKQIAQDVSGAFDRAKNDNPLNTPQFQTQLQNLLQGALRKCNVVTREDFDAQSVVLMRTREKLEALEKHVSRLEQTINQKTPQND